MSNQDNIQKATIYMRQSAKLMDKYMEIVKLATRYRQNQELTAQVAMERIINIILEDEDNGQG